MFASTFFYSLKNRYPRKNIIRGKICIKHKDRNIRIKLLG